MPPSAPLDLEEAVTDIPRDALLSTDQEVLVQWCLSRFGWPPPSVPAVQVGELHHHLTTSTKYTVHVPLLAGADYFQEGSELLRILGSCTYTSCGSGRVAELTFAVDQAASSNNDPNSLRTHMRQVLSLVREQAGEQASRARERVGASRAEAEARARRLLAQRVTIEEALDLAKADLGIPLTPDSDAVILPVRPVGLDLSKAMERASSGVPERTLDAAIQEQLLTTISNFTRSLERLPGTTKRLLGLDEEALRDVLLFIINSNWRVATGEAFSGKGKTDIQLQFDGRVAFTAELKVYDGPKVVADAVDQLTSYLTWRDTHAALVIFIVDRTDITAAMQKTRHAIENHSAWGAGPERRANSDRYMLTTRDASRSLTMDLIMVPLQV